MRKDHLGYRLSASLWCLLWCKRRCLLCAVISFVLLFSFFVAFRARLSLLWCRVSEPFVSAQAFTNGAISVAAGAAATPTLKGNLQRDDAH